MGSAIGPISPLVDWLMKVLRNLAVSAEKSNTSNSRFRKRSVTRGNCWDRAKLVHLPCCRESTKGWSIVVRDQGAGFGRNQIPDPSSFENPRAVHGRGIRVMKLGPDEISFERRGSAVYQRKAPERK